MIDKSLIKALLIAPLAAIPASLIYSLWLVFYPGSEGQATIAGYFALALGVATTTLILAYLMTWTVLLGLFLVLNKLRKQSLAAYLVASLVGGGFVALSHPDGEFLAACVFYSVCIGLLFWRLALGRKASAPVLATVHRWPPLK